MDVGGGWWDPFGRVRVTDVAKSRPLGLHGVCRAALPFEGLEDARPGVAPAPAFAGPRCFPVGDRAAVGGLGAAGELAFGLARLSVLVAGDPAHAFAWRGAGGELEAVGSSRGSSRGARRRSPPRG